MSDKENREIREENMENTDRTHRAKPTRRRKWWIFAAIFVVVLGVVLVAAWRDGTGFDALNRFFTYGKSTQDEAEIFAYDTDKTNRFASLNSSLVVLSMTQLRLYDSEGELLFSESVKMDRPALSVGKNLAVAYDVGGTDYYVFNEEEILLRGEYEADMPLISADINEDDYLAVVAGKSGFKGAVNVYDAELELIFEFNSSSRFLGDGAVFGGGKRVAAVALEQENATFVSTVVIYKTNATEEAAACKITDGLVLDITADGDTVCAVTDRSVVFIDDNGTMTGTYSYEGKFLRGYSLGGDGYATVLLNHYKSGSMATLVTVNEKGEVADSLDINEEVLSVSAAGRYVAVLYADRLVIYTSALAEYSTLENVDYAKAALMRADGSAMVAGASQAALYLP